jgi:hypothetical protein
MKKFLVFIICLLIPAIVWAAGSCTSTQKAITEAGITWYRIVTMNWVSTAGGAVSAVGSVPNVSGIIAEVHLIPDSNASLAPTNLYDVTILDSDGTDVLFGAGANMSNSTTATTNYIVPRNPSGGNPNRNNTTLTPSITNAGSAKKGTIRIFLR